jgi:hypothetical protein
MNVKFDHSKEKISEVFGLSDEQATDLKKQVAYSIFKFPDLGLSIEYLLNNVPEQNLPFALFMLGRLKGKRNTLVNLLQNLAMAAEIDAPISLFGKVFLAGANEDLNKVKQWAEEFSGEEFKIETVMINDGGELKELTPESVQEDRKEE